MKLHSDNALVFTAILVSTPFFIGASGIYYISFVAVNVKGNTD